MKNQCEEYERVFCVSQLFVVETKIPDMNNSEKETFILGSQFQSMVS